MVRVIPNVFASVEVLGVCLCGSKQCVFVFDIWKLLGGALFLLLYIFDLWIPQSPLLWPVGEVVGVFDPHFILFQILKLLLVSLFLLLFIFDLWIPQSPLLWPVGRWWVSLEEV